MSNRLPKKKDANATAEQHLLRKARNQRRNARQKAKRKAAR